MDELIKKIRSLEKRLEVLENKIGGNKQFKVTKKNNSNKESKISTMNADLSTKGNTKKLLIKSGKVELTKYTNGIILTGDTYDKKDTIKKYKGWWTPQMKGWTVKLENYDRLKKDLTDSCQKLTEKHQDKILDHIEDYKPKNNIKKQTDMNGFLSDSD